jgi:hypothetical protein
MTNTEIALLAHRAGFGEKTENSIRIEEFAKLKHFAEAVLAKQKPWVGLTPQERDEIQEQVYGAVPHHVAFHHAIEAKLKEKNT